MPYELAKKLRDAKFKVNHPAAFFCKGLGCWKEEGERGYFLHNISLEELIKECGGDFYGLLKVLDVWYCAVPHHTDRPLLYTKSSTPTEAVANLWLALNTKD